MWWSCALSYVRLAIFENENNVHFGNAMSHEVGQFCDFGSFSVHKALQTTNVTYGPCLANVALQFW